MVIIEINRQKKWCLEYSMLFMGKIMYEGWNFNSGNYLFTTDTK